MKWFRDALMRSPLFEEIEKAKTKCAFPIQLNGCLDTQICHMMNLIGEDYPLKLIVTHSEERARKLYEDYRLFDRDVLYYPAKDVLFYSADIHGSATQSQRLEVMKEIISKGSATVVTTIDGGLDRLLSLEQMEAFCSTLTAGQELVLSEYKGTLVDLGYESVPLVEKPGQYAIRGGILEDRKSVV